MTTPQDRILEVALAEVLGGRRPPDLEARILARARRPALRLPARGMAWAAAALLVAGLGLWALLSSPVVPVPPPAGLTAEEEAQAEAWIALQRKDIEVDVADPSSLERLKAQWTARRKLLDLLDEKPAGWAVIRSRLTPLPVGDEGRSARERFLEILARAPGAANDPLLLTRIVDDTFEVDEGSLLVLAEDGCAPARALLERRIAGQPPATPLAGAAAFLALQGDDRGAPALRRLLASSKSQEAMPGVALACAAGLHGLGDTGAWAEAVATQRRLADARLAQGDLDGARRIVAALVLVRPAVVDAATIRLGDLDRRVERMARSLGSELRTAASIKARLAELTE